MSKTKGKRIFRYDSVRKLLDTPSEVLKKTENMKTRFHASSHMSVWHSYKF